MFGGSGFVGANICKKAVASGLEVISVTRGARPNHLKEPWAEKVRWVKGDALDPKTYSDVIEGAHAVVVSVGYPPIPFASLQTQISANGLTVSTVAAAAKDQRIPRLVVVSATMPSFTPSGYKQGKQVAETAAQDYASSGLTSFIVRPSAIYGTRFTATGLPVPLWVVMKPLAVVLSALQTPFLWLERRMPWLEHAFEPPVDVNTLADTVVEAVTDERFSSGTCHIITNRDMVLNDPQVELESTFQKSGSHGAWPAGQDHLRCAVQDAA